MSTQVSFLGIPIHVAQGVLVPRAETELLAETARSVLEASNLSRPRLIDMCTGSGNLACALAAMLPSAHVWASDVMEACARSAAANVQRLGLSRRVAVLRGDLFEAFANLGLESTIDMVVCNPPYISRARLDGASSHLLAGEPREAFDGGPYGLSIHQRVMREAPGFLCPGGWLLFEVGVGQGAQVRKLFDRTRAYGEVRLVADATGEPRVALARTRSDLDVAAE